MVLVTNFVFGLRKSYLILNSSITSRIWYKVTVIIKYKYKQLIVPQSNLSVENSVLLEALKEA